VLFFNVKDREVTDVEIVEIEQSNLMFSFKELYDIIQNYIDRSKGKKIKKLSPKTNKITEFFKTVKKLRLINL